MYLQGVAIAADVIAVKLSIFERYRDALQLTALGTHIAKEGWPRRRCSASMVINHNSRLGTNRLSLLAHVICCCLLKIAHIYLVNIVFGWVKATHQQYLFARGGIFGFNQHTGANHALVRLARAGFHNHSGKVR